MARRPQRGGSALIHQRVSLWLPLALTLACGGGGGGPDVDRDWSPDEIPSNSDHVPPPNSNDPPPPPTTRIGPSVSGGNGDGGGGECADLCSQLTTRGCSSPVGECVADCQDQSGPCVAEQRALARCILRNFCPEELEAAGDEQALAQVLNACPNEFNAALSCETANE